MAVFNNFEKYEINARKVRACTESLSPCGGCWGALHSPAKAFSVRAVSGATLEVRPKWKQIFRTGMRTHWSGENPTSRLVGLHMTDEMRRQINIFIVQVSQGNTFALEGLSRLVSARMLSIALSIVKNRMTAEDVVQDSFLKIVNNAHQFKPQTNGYAWICKITQNVALNVLRKEGRWRSENIDDFFNLSSEEDVAEKSTSKLLLRRAMETLTDFEKRVIYQKYFMDFTVRDSAKSLGKSKSAVQRAITSAEVKLKNYIYGGTNSPSDGL